MPDPKAVTCYNDIPVVSAAEFVRLLTHREGSQFGDAQNKIRPQLPNP